MSTKTMRHIVHDLWQLLRQTHAYELGCFASKGRCYNCDVVPLIPKSRRASELAAEIALELPVQDSCLINSWHSVL